MLALVICFYDGWTGPQDLAVQALRPPKLQFFTSSCRLAFLCFVWCQLVAVYFGSSYCFRLSSCCTPLRLSLSHVVWQEQWKYFFPYGKESIVPANRQYGCRAKPLFGLWSREDLLCWAEEPRRNFRLGWEANDAFLFRTCWAEKPISLFTISFPAVCWQGWETKVLGWEAEKTC